MGKNVSSLTTRLYPFDLKTKKREIERAKARSDCVRWYNDCSFFLPPGAAQNAEHPGARRNQMISDFYRSTGPQKGSVGQPSTRKQFRSLRNFFIVSGKTQRSQRGFTLTELMIVLAVITIVATIAFIGLRNNQFEGAYLRFTDDLVGTMIQARNRAIDDQTVVRVEVSEDRVEVYWIDPNDQPPDSTVFGTGTLMWGNYRDRMDGGLIADEACITGMEPGISPPSEVNNAVMPVNCGTNLPRAILFQPDGSFILNDDPQPDAGMTMVIQDSSSATMYYSIIEMFPGGLIRKFDEIPQL